MCPENRIRHSRIQQQGFLMPLALFILVGLGALAIAISRLSSGQFSSAVQEALSAQAFYAAESASQVAMNRILFDTADKVSADLKCAAVNGSTINFSAVGLRECSAQLVCIAVANAGDTAGIYRIESTATCGGGTLSAARRLVSAVRYE
jgi:MSHA biogenesis protein MshP